MPNGPYVFPGCVLSATAFMLSSVLNSGTLLLQGVLWLLQPHDPDAPSLHLSLPPSLPSSAPPKEIQGQTVIWRKTQHKTHAQENGTGPQDPNGRGSKDPSG